MSKFEFTPIEEIDKIHAELKAGFYSGKLKDVAYRKYQILQLLYLLKDNSKRFEESFASDLGRPPLESQFFEIASCIGEIYNYYKSVDKWAKPERAPFSLLWFPMRPTIYKEPKGVVLIIAPFNYPIFLSLLPLASAIAAGNTVVLKPSESTPATSALFAELFPKYLDNDLVRVVNGSVPETTRLLELPWGHILYTGGGRVGRIVATAAAKHLTPVTLELGGKSPVFVDPKCDLKMTARRILWGKAANAGQTCVAPDYIIVPRSFQDTLIKAFKEAHDEFYPDGPKAPGQMSRLVTPQAFARVSGLLKNTKGTVVLGGETDEATKFIAPTVIKDVKPDDALMSEEIFGPLLPIMPVDSIDEGIAYVNAHDHPLAIYAFTNDEQFKMKIFNSTQSGSAHVNETIIHPGAEGLPFGGVGPSGSGYHTGKYGFDIFTHLRSSLHSPGWVDALMSFRYPPYTAAKIKSMNRTLMPSIPARPKGPPKLSSGVSWSK
ncbi:NAD-aldehyde dehydrogenase [Dendrothele bispora CBS 962.96]|uniref:Aldehyde dehydrogenase n=1 Tax=Dendrothele bispora (strain CBS 962.96) TaxID=1314807 RepID=A0A4S8L7X4_DENBC|nr:NAD-aldehyde dehydrogenase [Dendrothele bispora CBS 962.96]